MLVTGKICLSNLNATLKLKGKDNCSQISSCVEVIHSRRKEHNLLAQYAIVLVIWILF